MNSIKVILFFLVPFLVNVALGSQTERPAVFAVVHNQSTVDLDKLLNSAITCLIDTRIDELTRISNSITDDSGDAVRLELAAWNRAKSQWKAGDPIPFGCEAIVISEEGAEFCVVFYFPRIPAFICYLSKDNYRVINRPESRQMKAAILTQK